MALPMGFSENRQSSHLELDNVTFSWCGLPTGFHDSMKFEEDCIENLDLLMSF